MSLLLYFVVSYPFALVCRSKKFPESSQADIYTISVDYKINVCVIWSHSLNSLIFTHREQRKWVDQQQMDRNT